jgi:hypothetical protein
MSDLVRAKTRSKAVVAVFNALKDNTGVGGSFPCNDCWIHASDWARIIACEYELDERDFTGEDFVKAVHNHHAYRSLNGSTGTNNVFHHWEKLKSAGPKNKRRTDHWYFCRKKALVHNITGTSYAFSRFGEVRKQFNIPADDKATLAKWLAKSESVSVGSRHQQSNSLATLSRVQHKDDNACTLKPPPNVGNTSSLPGRSLPDQNPAASTVKSPVRALGSQGLVHALIPHSSNSVRQLTASYENANSPERQDRDKRRKPGSPPSRSVGRQERTRTDIPTVACPEKSNSITMQPSNCHRVTNVMNSFDDLESNVLSPTLQQQKQR